MSEKNFQDKVKNLLDERGAYHEVIWGGGFQASGIPDILACYNGVFLGLELKAKNGRPSPLQLAKVNMIRKAGGVGAIIWDSIESVEDILDSIDKGELDKVKDKYTKKEDSL